MADTIYSQNHTPLIQVPATLFVILSPSIVAARFWARRQMKLVLGSDDWTILVSMIFSIGDCSSLITACAYGFGKHASTLSPYNRIMALKFFYCSQILYKLSLNFTKISLLLLYLRAITLQPIRITCWIMLGIIISYGIAATVATILQCSPLPRAWDKTVPGTCFNITAFWYANATYAIATDLVILIMPMRVVWGLQLRWIQKIAVLIVFALGGVVTVCSIARMTTLATSSTTSDPTYDISSTMWANIESNVAILCACLPIFRRPLARLFPQLLSPLGTSATATTTVNDQRSFPRPEFEKSHSMSGSIRKGSDVPDFITTAVAGGPAPLDFSSEEYSLEHIEIADIEGREPRGHSENSKQ